MSAITRQADCESYEARNVVQQLPRNKLTSEEYKKEALKSKVNNVAMHILGVLAVTLLTAMISLATGGAAIVPLAVAIAFGVTSLGSIAHLFAKIFPQCDDVAYKDETKNTDEGESERSKENTKRETPTGEYFLNQLPNMDDDDYGNN